MPVGIATHAGAETVQVLTQLACTLGLGTPATLVCFPPISALPSLALTLGLEKVLKHGHVRAGTGRADALCLNKEL